MKNEQTIMSMNICGYLTRKTPFKVHTSKSGEEFVSFVLFDNPYKKKADSQPIGESVRYKVVAWGEFAKLIINQSAPGQQVNVKGFLYPTSWRNSNNEIVLGYEIKAYDISLGRLPNEKAAA